MNFVPERADTLYVAVFGPGYGESIVIRVPPATWIVVDGCHDDSRRSTALGVLADNAAQCAAIFLTHPHDDHVFGLAELVENAASSNCLLACTDPRVREPDEWTSSPDPVVHETSAALEALLASFLTAWNRDPASRWCPLAGQSRCIGEAEIRVLHPTDDSVQGFKTGAITDKNRVSTVLSLRWRGVQLLLGGDLPAKDWPIAEKCHPDLANHLICKVPHHASREACAPEWMFGGGRQRVWIVTPFTRGRATLPRFEDGQGAHILLNHVDEFLLTQLPHAAAGWAEVQRLERPVVRDALHLSGPEFPISFDVSDRCPSYVTVEFDSRGSLVSRHLGEMAKAIQEQAEAGSVTGLHPATQSP